MQQSILDPRPSEPAAPPRPPTPSARDRAVARARRLWRGRPQDPAWTRAALLGLLGLTFVLYVWGLGASGWANSFYSAAVQAGSDSWTAFFFGASDAAGSITVDKPPLALWPMALSVRLLGLSSWSILLPQALMGVGTVALLHATVRRATGSPAAGLLAGVVLATTPVAVLMFRFNNPDALLVLLMTGAAYATLRALERPERAVRWLVLGGALVGLAFLTKTLQAFLVLPALAVAYGLCAAVPLGRRLVHLLAALGAVLVAGGWWVAVVELWPASARPWIGGSQTNSFLELTFGYNGFGRLTGEETGSVGGGGGGGWGETGLLRMFGSDVAGQVAWLLPAAGILLVAALWLTLRRAGLRAGRTSPVTASLVLWGLWLGVTALTFSLMAGIFHAYYTVALAPAVAALVGTGLWVLWTQRTSLGATFAAAVTVAFSSAYAFTLLGRTPDFAPWLRWVVVVVGLAAAALLLLHRLLPARAAAAVAIAAVIAVLAGPSAYALETAATPHTGSIPSAGPSGGADPGGRAGGPGGMPGRTGDGQPGTHPGGATGTAPGIGTAPGGATGTGRGGGLLDGSEPTAALTALLAEDADSYTWVAAAVGSNSASGYQLATQEPVMPIGGFNGTDPSPTLAEFQQLVADGEIHWFIGGGGGGMRAGGSGTSEQISSWVEETFASRTVDGVTLYDLSEGVR
ncbi:ArnT family glycosyltransferase [Aeromicrobium massiliense]|uniref:ArnT family glycosyltransferase n=1 Tax=Aeromicrobium massiliense TaxID=1464554 RepID=UPI0005789E2E|nr:glycosyltransferase family 39 protein [Aeromicrobium massiliense]